MAIVGIMSWWYTAGLVQALRAVGKRLSGLLDFFSIDLLLKTLFAPFRQISAGRVNGPVGVQLRAFFDRLLSRLIGAFIRTCVMIGGVIALLFVVIGGVGYVLLWVMVPLLPIVGLTLMLAGWIPWQS